MYCLCEICSVLNQYIVVFGVVDFFNWNRVKVRYCDGASFSGRPEAELKVIIWLSLCVWTTRKDP